MKLNVYKEKGGLKEVTLRKKGEIKWDNYQTDNKIYKNLEF